MRHCQLHQRALFHECPADAVFLDLHLPDENGLDVLAVLRCLNPGVRCALMHGGSLDHSDDELLAAGATVVLLKPFTPEEVVAVVRRLTMSPSVAG